MGSADLVVACDLEALPAGVCLKDEFTARLIYDAHEFWPFSFPNFSIEDQLYWMRVERGLVRAADRAFAVSRQLSLYMSQAYGVNFETLPNAVPLAMVRALPVAKKVDGGVVRFLFLGGFGEGRGLRQLLGAWPEVDSNCHLFFQGPSSIYRDSLKAEALRLELLDTRVFFPDPVPEADLIQAAAQVDVGLIPYEPTSINNKFCCPNKLSQYMAAGIPIISNNTVFVAEILQMTEAGIAIDFNDQKALIDTINKFGSDAYMRRRLGANARSGFESAFHWELNAELVLSFTSSIVSRERSIRIDPQTALEAAFPATVDRREPMPRRVLIYIWHRTPLLRTVVLKNNRLRGAAERLRSMFFAE